MVRWDNRHIWLCCNITHILYFCLVINMWKMPATYSKIRDKDKKDPGPRYKGGPLKRTVTNDDSTQSIEWDTALGSSLEVLPMNKLPVVRAVLRRYRCLRILEPRTSISKLANRISQEVKVIWDRAGTPTVSLRGCPKRVEAAVNLWYSKHNPEERLSESFQASLDELLDLKPKLRGNCKNAQTIAKENEQYRDIMRKTGVKKRKQDGDKSDDSDWETDFKFYLDQLQVS